MLDNGYSFVANKATMPQSIYGRFMQKHKIIKRYKESCSNFIKAFGMAPNALFCSWELLNIIIDDIPKNLIKEGTNHYYQGYRVIFTDSHLIFWYKFNTEDDLEETKYLLDDFETNLFHETINT